MYVYILKVGFQVLALVVGVTSAIQAHRISTGHPSKKKLNKIGWLTITMLAMSFAVFVATELTQQDTIAELKTVNKNLLTLRADHDLAGLDISFKPSNEQWSRIAKHYSRIESRVSASSGETFPYRDATMIAERNGDGWKVDFGPVHRIAGVARFSRLPPGDKKQKAFEEIIHEASIALWIKWDAGIETELEPRRGDYASAITISQERITLTLRPPMIRLNVNSLIQNPTIILRSSDEGDNLPKSLTFRSLDSVVVLDQTINLTWKTDDGDEYIKKTKPRISGPHTLQLSFRTT